MNLGPAEILVILVIALLVFGPNRLPEIGRQVGKGVREFRKFQRSVHADLHDVLGDDGGDHEPAPTLPPKQEPPAVPGVPDADVKDPGPSDSGAPPEPPAGPTT